MRRQLIGLLLSTSLGLATVGCGAGTRGGSEAPPAAQFARVLPSGSVVAEVAYADLNADGRHDALVTATVSDQGSRHLTALVFLSEPRRTYSQVVRRRLRGDVWLPIAIGRAGAGAPLAAVFAARSGRDTSLSYIVVQQHGRAVAVTMENANLPDGKVRFVPEGLLESRGDTDRLWRWIDATWQSEDLYSQYLPPLPTDTITIAYTVDAVRGPVTDTPRVVRARLGQHLFLRRMDRGEPSRVQVVGSGASFAIHPDGVISLRHPGTVEIHIENPAYSGRTLVLAVRVDP